MFGAHDWLFRRKIQASATATAALPLADLNLRHKNTRTNRMAARPVRPAILYILPDLEYGSTARQTLDLAININRNGWQPVMASAGGSLRREAERASIQHHLLRPGRTGLIENWRQKARLDAIYKNTRPQIVHCIGPETLSLGKMLGKSYGVPLLVDMPQPCHATLKLKKSMAALAQLGAHFRVPSEFMSDHLITDFNVPYKQISLIYNGVDLEIFSPQRISAERIKSLAALWRLPEQATVILMPMPFMANYGHTDLFEVLSKINSPHIHLVCVNIESNQNAHRADLMRQISAYGLTGRVTMPDYCTDWAAALWLADLVVAPNKTPRGQAFEVTLAAAMGRPAIVTDCGANPEMVAGGATAWLVKAGDTNALGAAVSEAVAMTEQQRLDMAERTRHFIADYFQQDIAYSSIADLYATLGGHKAVAKQNA